MPQILVSHMHPKGTTGTDSDAARKVSSGKHPVAN